jgi:iron complex transport system permease protein
MKKLSPRFLPKNFWALVISTATLFLICVLALNIGPFDISLKQSFYSLFHSGRSALEQQNHTIIFNIRLPRIFLGGLVGAALAVSGGTYQSVFRNQLADPYLLGAASGAGLGATIALTSTRAGYALIPLFAFVGALATIALTVSLSGRFFHDPSTLLLSGIAISSFATAIQTYLQQRHSENLRPIYAWILGGLTTASWKVVSWTSIYIGISLCILFLTAKKMDALLLSDEEATSLGVHVKKIRMIAIICASFATATAVAASGLIGFVGLVVPHLVRGALKQSSNKLLPIMAVTGAALLILADLGSRTVISPAELPIGVITAFIGAPFFLFILRKKRLSD